MLNIAERAGFFARARLRVRAHTHMHAHPHAQMEQAKWVGNILDELERSRVDAAQIASLLKFHRIDLAIVKAGSRQVLPTGPHEDSRRCPLGAVLSASARCSPLVPLKGFRCCMPAVLSTGCMLGGRLVCPPVLQGAWAAQDC